MLEMPRPKKIVVIGPESTGKSTLSAALAEALNTVWVPEYARTYLGALGRPYEEHDLLNISAGQFAAEQQSMAIAAGALICDTDGYVLKVWSEASYGRCHRLILEAIATATRPAAYLLTGIDVAWIADPLREHPAPRDRRYFYHQYLDIVQHSGVPFAIITGAPEDRLGTALEAIRGAL